MSKPPPGDVRLEPQVFDGARPVGSRFEVVCELGYHFVRQLRVERFQPFADALVEPCSAPGCQSVIEHLAVQRMHELVPLGNGAVGKMLGGRRSHDLVPAARDTG